MTDRDKDLERRFTELRSRDARHTPSFDAVLRAPRRRVRWVPLAAAALLMVAAFIVAPRLQTRPAERVRWLVDWQSPTASLLAVPGPDLLNRVPSISTSIIHLEEP